MIAFWVILHGLVAIALLGAVTHQCLSYWRRPRPAVLFIEKFRAVPAAGYANAVVVLYLTTFVIGAYVYPTFVLDVKGSLVDAGMRKTIGLFQIKEHVAVIGVGLLPVYWDFWRREALTAFVATRRFLTTVMMLIVWWNLVVGHILNNVKGLI